VRDIGIVRKKPTQACERVLIKRALARTGGRRIEAAQALGVGRNTITRKIQEVNIDGGRPAKAESKESSLKALIVAPAKAISGYRKKNSKFGIKKPELGRYSRRLAWRPSIALVIDGPQIHR
jgi:transposase